jgi:arylsulfatase
MRPTIVTVTAIWAASIATADGRKPNIVFILTDDQGYGDLSCHGNPVLKTPNIDRLYAQSVRFTDFHVSPTCAPTRAALLTGRHEFKNGVTHTILERERLTPRAKTLPQVLKSAGYATGIFGKWHLGDEPEYWPIRRGYDEMFIHGAGGIGQSFPGSGGDAPGNTYFDPVILHNGTFVKTRGYCTDVFFSQALAWIEQVKGSRPFYCQIATNTPHAPLDARPDDERIFTGRVADARVAQFFGMIYNIDVNVGRLLAKLEAWKLDRDTLVIFMNDNGGTVGVPIHNAGMRGSKGTPWLGGTRAASLWRWPDTLKPGDCDRLAAHVDFLPTLAQLAGVTLAPALIAQVEGRSLVPLLFDPKAPWDDRVLFTHVGRWPKGADVNDFKYAHCSVRTMRWHLVCVTGGKKNWQLFDVPADPGEKTDVAALHPEVVNDLDAAYDQWWASLEGLLVNEQVIAPKVNAFKELYQKQCGRTSRGAGAGSLRTGMIPVPPIDRLVVSPL